MQAETDVLIIGGGLAGLTSGIHLSACGYSVTVIEKSAYPRHKVCGEYISNEILPYFKWLGADIQSLNPVIIDKLSFSSFTGKPINAQLPLGGFGLSRYALDYHLYTLAIDKGCGVIIDTVTNVAYDADIFTVQSASGTYKAKVVLGAYGKRSGLDLTFNRKFIRTKSPWLAVKAHYKGNFPEDTVGLHHFPGGYCGVSKVEDGSINICYLAAYDSFRKYKDVDAYQTEVLGKNPQLKAIFSSCESVFEKPLTISQISFDHKNAVQNHILMIGDTAGLIHPLCGNGMAMAMHSAKIASEKVIEYMQGKISRIKMEEEYAKEWNRNFAYRIKLGRLLGNILQKHELTKMILRIIGLFPSSLSFIVKQTHGKPVTI